MKMGRFIFAAFSTSLAIFTNAASYDCSKAVSRIDNAICASPVVSKLDEDLSAAYKDALANNSDLEAVKVAQRAWLKQTRSQCADEACLVTVYRQRIAALSGTALKEAITGEEKNPQPVPSIPPAAAPSVEASVVAVPVASTPLADSSTVVAQESPAQLVATPLAPSSQQTEASDTESRYSLYGLVAILFAIVIALVYLVIRKRVNWKIALGFFGMLVVIGAYFAPSFWRFAFQVAYKSEQGATKSTTYAEELDEKLTGKWTTDDDVAPACQENGEFWIRQANGTMEVSGSDGTIIEKSTWKIEKAYDKNLAAIRIEHQNRSPIYWVIQFSGQDMKSSVMLSSAPEDKDEALQALVKPDPKYPDIERLIFHKCKADAERSAATINAAQADLQEKFIQDAFNLEDSETRIFRRQSKAGELFRTALTLAYYSDDKRCKDMWNDELHATLSKIATLDKQAATPGANDAIAIQIATDRQAAVRQSGCAH